jgi:WhiB family redox-sensing transcriptional regulator
VTLSAEQATIQRYSRQQPRLRGHDQADWRLRAACRTSTVEFHPADNLRGGALWHVEAQAKAVCAQCPVCRRCRQHALDTREPHGIWGGTTSSERALSGLTEQS